MAKKIKQPIEKGVCKVPVVMQLEALECGAACLAMVLAYYEKWIPLEQVRYDCGVSRDGSNAQNILLAARSYGLEAQGFRFEPESLKSDGMFPCIIHWNFNHFVVCDGFKGNKVYLNDPAKGNYTVSMEDFDKAFTGVALFFEPTESFEPSGKPKSMLSFAKSRLQGTGVAVAFVALTGIIASLMGLINPVFSRIFMDRLITYENPEWVPLFFTMMILLALVQIVMSWIQTVYSLKINGKMNLVGSSSYMWKLLRMPMDFFSQRMVGDLIGRLSLNASIAGTLVNTFAPLLLQFVMMIFYLVIILRYSVLLTVVGILSTIITSVFSTIISKKRINVSRVLMRDSAKLSSATVSGLEMVETIKAAGAENGYFEKWAGYQASVNAQSVKITGINMYWGLIPTLVGTLTNTIVLIMSIGLVIQNQFTVGQVTAFTGFLAAFLAPVSTMIGAAQSIMEMRTQMERVEDVMSYPIDSNFNDAPAPEGTSFSKLSGTVEMKDVTFGYSRLGKPLIENFNLSLKPGSRVAFVGASGCGKSTLSKLISGLYQPWSGEILFDGKPMKEIDRSVFSGSLSVVDQDIILFEDTIANNIKMWDDSIEDFEMIMAARDAQIHEDIMQREGGYQYKLIEGGKDFSGGQRQRLEIARVLAQDPTIIILDEATSALDAKTEYDVVNSIRDRGITCIVVAHRLSTIRDCDEIIVLDKGKVVERGTHDELYAAGGLYTRLVTNE